MSAISNALSLSRTSIAAQSQPQTVAAAENGFLGLAGLAPLPDPMRAPPVPTLQPVQAPNQRQVTVRGENQRYEDLHDRGRSIVDIGVGNQIRMGDSPFFVYMDGRDGMYTAGHGNNFIHSMDPTARVVLGNGGNYVFAEVHDLTMGNGDNKIVPSMHKGRLLEKAKIGHGNNRISGTIGELVLGNGKNMLNVTGAGDRTRIHLGNGFNTITMKNGQDANLHLGNGHTELKGDAAGMTIRFDGESWREGIAFSRQGDHLVAASRDGMARFVFKDAYTSGQLQALKEKPVTLMGQAHMVQGSTGQGSTGQGATGQAFTRSLPKDLPA